MQTVRKKVKDRAAQNKTSGLHTGHRCLKEPCPGSRAELSLCSHLPCLARSCWGSVMGAVMGVGEEGGSLLTPQALFLPVLFGLFREDPQHQAPRGLSRPGLPMAWSCFSPGHHCWLPSALATSHVAWCPGRSLCGGITQQEMFPKQGCVESLTACGLALVSLVGALLAPFLPPQAALASLPTDKAASPHAHEVCHGYTSPAAPKAAVGLS